MGLFSKKSDRVGGVVAADGLTRVAVNGGYDPQTLVVAAGEPVKIVFTRHDGSLCSEEVVFPEQGVRASLPQHADVVVELPPLEPGEYGFECGMGMMRGRLVAR